MKKGKPFLTDFLTKLVSLEKEIDQLLVHSPGTSARRIDAKLRALQRAIDVSLADGQLTMLQGVELLEKLYKIECLVGFLNRISIPAASRARVPRRSAMAVLGTGLGRVTRANGHVLAKNQVCTGSYGYVP